MSNGKRNSYLLYEKKLLSVILARCKNEGQQTTGSERFKQDQARLGIPCSNFKHKETDRTDGKRQEQTGTDKIRNSYLR